MALQMFVKAYAPDSSWMLEQSKTKPKMLNAAEIDIFCCSSLWNYNLLNFIIHHLRCGELSSSVKVFYCDCHLYCHLSSQLME